MNNMFSSFESPLMLVIGEIEWLRQSSVANDEDTGQRSLAHSGRVIAGVKACALN